ncbi:unnamed protein product [Bursaphelenchus okinawaensis]|uniref:Uncharacterized protein n=1 Tax=Bursaphelenchus okinawaensis TaxID=465554 RepID=A0A811JSJ2_9BILA|nr:unnamed protein product [Bursaphelenchus okinawaensis]CAG9081250.1 unnamed protein product [Bursaphelenchus okinawaensis]
MLPSEDSNTLGSDGQQSNRSFNGTVNSTNGKAYSVTVPSTRRSYTTTTIVTSTTFTQSFMTKAAIAPVWSVGLGLVLLVVCVGLNITAVTLYLCYRRKNVRRRDPPVNTIKTSTLHAFPPQQHHGPVMHSTMA